METFSNIHAKLQNAEKPSRERCKKILGTTAQAWTYWQETISLIWLFGQCARKKTQKMNYCIYKQNPEQKYTKFASPEIQETIPKTTYDKRIENGSASLHLPKNKKNSDF